MRRSVPLLLLGAITLAACNGSSDGRSDGTAGPTQDAATSDGGVEDAPPAERDAVTAGDGPLEDTGPLPEDGTPTDPCEGVSCGDHGECVVDEGLARCECDPGYGLFAGLCIRVYPMVCQVAGEASISTPDDLDDALWWNGAWYLAVDDSLAKLSGNGSTLIDWTQVETGTSYLHAARLGATASSLIGAFSGSGGSSVQTLELAADLSVKSGPHTLSTGFSGNLAITTDATAALWAQGYASGSEGHWLGFLAADGTLTATPMALNGSKPLAASTAVAAGSGQVLGAFTVGSVYMQRYDTSGAALGPLVALPDSSSSDGSVAAAYGGSNFLVVYNEYSAFGWLRYATVDPSSGTATAFEIELTNADIGEPTDQVLADVGDPTVATHGGRFGIAWVVKARTNNTHHAFFALVDSDGTLLAKPVHLGRATVVPWPGRSQVVAAGASGFVVFWSRHNYGTRMSTLSCSSQQP